MLITFGPFIILAVVGFFVYIHFGFEFKSAYKTACLIFGLFLIVIPSTIYCESIADKIGEQLPVYEVVLEQKEYPECGIVVEKRGTKFKDWRHNFIAKIPFPQIRGVCRQNE